MKYYVATFPEGEFGDIFDFDDESYALGFAGGVEAGSGYYGGGASAYLLPTEEAKLREEIKASEVESCLAVLAKEQARHATPSEGDPNG